MNRRDIFKALAVVPAAIVPRDKPKPELDGFTIRIPKATLPGQSITVVAMGSDKWAVMR